MSAKGRTTRKTGAAVPAAVAVKTEIKSEDVVDDLDVDIKEESEEPATEVEQEDEDFVSFNVDDEEEEQIDNGEEHEEDAAEEEKADAPADAEIDDEKQTEDSEEKTAEGDEGKSKEEAKEEKVAEPALPKRENYTVAAYFKMRELSDLTILQPFLENCTGIHVTIQGISGKEKTMTAQMVYKTALYKPDMAALREIKLRGEPLEDLKIRGEPVEPPARVYVSNIPDDTIEDLLQMLFPNATKVTIPKTASGNSKGCAMLTFPCLADAEECVKENAGMKIEKNELAMKVMATVADRPSVVRPSVVKRPFNTAPAASIVKRARNDRACYNCGRPGHFARECDSSTDVNGRPITGGGRPGAQRQRTLMGAPVAPVQQPNAEIMAQQMANNMAVKMQQMQERMTAVMTEKILNQVSTQIASQQQVAAHSNAAANMSNQGPMMGGASRSPNVGGWGGMHGAGNQGMQSDGVSRTQMKKKQRQQRMRDRMPDGGGAGADTGFGNFQARFGSGSSGQYGSVMGNSGRSGYY